MDTHDLHATILHLLGLDHEALTYTECGNPARNPAVKLMPVETERGQGVDVEKADHGNSASNSATWRLVSVGAFGPDFSMGRPVSLSLPMRASWARGARRLRMMRPPSMAAFSESLACKPRMRRMGPGRTPPPLLEIFVCMVRRSYLFFRVTVSGDGICLYRPASARLLPRLCEKSRRPEDGRPRLSLPIGFQAVGSVHGRPEARLPSQPGRLFSAARRLFTQSVPSAATTVRRGSRA